MLSKYLPHHEHAQEAVSKEKYLVLQKGAVHFLPCLEEGSPLPIWEGHGWTFDSFIRKKPSHSLISPLIRSWPPSHRFSLTLFWRCRPTDEIKGSEPVRNGGQRGDLCALRVQSVPLALKIGAAGA